MEEADSTSQPGGVDPVPEVLSPPAGTAQHLSSATARLLCPHWNCGAVSPRLCLLNPVSAVWKSSNVVKLKAAARFRVLFPLSLVRNWNKGKQKCCKMTLMNLFLNLVCQTGGSAGSSCGAMLCGGGGEERHGWGGDLQDFRDLQWH